MCWVGSVLTFPLGWSTTSAGNHLYCFFLQQIEVPFGNQTWKWKMDHPSVVALLRPPFIGGFSIAMFDYQRVIIRAFTMKNDQKNADPLKDYYFPFKLTMLFIHCRWSCTSLPMLVHLQILPQNSSTIHCLGGGDKRSVWGIYIPFIFPIQWGAVWSYVSWVSKPSNSLWFCSQMFRYCPLIPRFFQTPHTRCGRPEDPVHVPYFQVGAGPPALRPFETLFWDAPIGHVGRVFMLGESCDQPCQKPRTTVLTLGTMIDWLSHNHRWLIPWEEIIDHPMLWLSSF